MTYSLRFSALAVAALLSGCTTYTESVGTTEFADLTGTKADTRAVWYAPFMLGDAPDTKNVQVLGRTWSVSPVEDQTDVYVAQRDNNNNNAFGRPVARRTPQGIRAIELASSCRVVRSSLIQDISGRVYASVVCK